MTTIEESYKLNDNPIFVEHSKYGVFDVTNQNCGEDFINTAIEESYLIADNPEFDLSIRWNIHKVIFKQL